MRKAEGHEGAEHGVFQRYTGEPSFLKKAGVYTLGGHKKIQGCEAAGVFSSEMPEQKTQHPALIWQGKNIHCRAAAFNSSRNPSIQEYSSE